MHELDRFIHQLCRYSDAVRQFAGLEGLQPHCRIDDFFKNLLRVRCRYLFNFCAAFLRRHHHYPAGAAVHNNANIIFLYDLAALFDKQPFYYFAFGSGLMGN
ncbi:hypothetical protein D3C73_1481590 [compost metagenome]